MTGECLVGEKKNKILKTTPIFSPILRHPATIVVIFFVLEGAEIQTEKS